MMLRGVRPLAQRASHESSPARRDLQKVHQGWWSTSRVYEAAMLGDSFHNRRSRGENRFFLLFSAVKNSIFVEVMDSLTFVFVEENWLLLIRTVFGHIFQFLVHNLGRWIQYGICCAETAAVTLCCLPSSILCQCNGQTVKRSKSSLGIRIVEWRFCASRNFFLFY